MVTYTDILIFTVCLQFYAAKSEKKKEDCPSIANIVIAHMKNQCVGLSFLSEQI